VSGTFIWVGEFQTPFFGQSPWHRCQKKADVAEHPRVFNHVGLLFNGPPDISGCPLPSHPTTSTTIRP
jgi:hypothetical protein